MHFYAILPTFLCFLLASQVHSLRYACPVDIQILQNLQPCTCSSTWENVNSKIRVTCNGFSETTKIMNSLNALVGYKIDELYLNGVQLGSSYLPEDPFLDSLGNSAVEIETIIISGGSSIAGIGASLHGSNSNHTFFSGLGSSLKHLKIENTKGVGNWAWDRLANSLSTGLQTASTSSSSNSSTSVSCTESLALESVVLYNNEFTELPKTFDSMGDSSLGLNPDRIILRNNKIVTIYATLIFNNMNFLDLSSNLIETTGALFLNSSNIYQIPENLQSIYLNNNKLTILVEKISMWEAIGEQTLNGWVMNDNKLKYINLNNNLIDCHCSAIRWTWNRHLSDILDGTCNGPDSVRAKLLSSHSCA